MYIKLPSGGGVNKQVCSVNNKKKKNAELNFHICPSHIIIQLFFFHEWEHTTGSMCPFLSLYPSRKGKESNEKNKKH